MGIQHLRYISIFQMFRFGAFLKYREEGLLPRARLESYLLTIVAHLPVQSAMQNKRERRSVLGWGLEARLRPYMQLGLGIDQ